MLLGRCLSIFSIQNKIDGGFLTVKGSNYVAWALFVHILGSGQNRWGISDRQGFKIMLFGRCLSIFSVEDKIEGVFLTVKGSK